MFHGQIAPIDQLERRQVRHKVLVVGHGPAREWFEKRLPGAVFAGFQAGQWFEAFVQREPRSLELGKGLHVQAIPPLDPLTASEFDEFWESLPTTEELDESSQDWTA